MIIDLWSSVNIVQQVVDSKSYDNKSKKLATLVEGDPKASFSIATTPRCREGHYSIRWIAPLYP